MNAAKLLQPDFPLTSIKSTTMDVSKAATVSQLKDRLDGFLYYLTEEPQFTSDELKTDFLRCVIEEFVASDYFLEQTPGRRKKILMMYHDLCFRLDLMSDIEQVFNDKPDELTNELLIKSILK